MRFLLSEQFKHEQACHAGVLNGGPKRGCLFTNSCRRPRRRGRRIVVFRLRTLMTRLFPIETANFLPIFDHFVAWTKALKRATASKRTADF